MTEPHDPANTTPAAEPRRWMRRTLDVATLVCFAVHVADQPLRCLAWSVIGFPALSSLLQRKSPAGFDGEPVILALRALTTAAMAFSLSGRALELRNPDDAPNVAVAASVGVMFLSLGLAAAWTITVVSAARRRRAADAAAAQRS